MVEAQSSNDESILRAGSIRLWHGDAIKANSVTQMLICQRVDSQLAGSPDLVAPPPNPVCEQAEQESVFSPHQDSGGVSTSFSLTDWFYI